MSEEKTPSEIPTLLQTAEAWTNPVTQVNMATVGDNLDDNEEEERTKTSKGGLKGSPPAKFNSDRKAAKQFLNDFRAYRFLNRKNETMRVPANQVALTLTFIKGKQVQDWANAIMDLMEE